MFLITLPSGRQTGLQVKKGFARNNHTRTVCGAGRSSGFVGGLRQNRARCRVVQPGRAGRLSELRAASVQPGSVAVVPSPYPGGQDTIVLVVGLDTTGRTADVVPLRATSRADNAATVYEREAGAATRFERIDKLVPIRGAEREDSKDAWIVHQREIEAAKAERLSPAGEAAARAEMEQLEANIDPRIFERAPPPAVSPQQLWIGAGFSAGAALAFLVVQSQTTTKGDASTSGALNAVAVVLGVVAVGLVLAALQKQSDRT